jgi:hypothetical protein
MFVLCELYRKDKKGKSQDNLDKEVWIKYKERTQKNPRRGKRFVPQSVQTGTDRYFYSVGTMVSFLRSNVAEHEADHSPPPSSEVKNE